MSKKSLEKYGGIDYKARWEEKNGKVPKGMILHHINFDKMDNRLENLILISIGQHNLFHRLHRIAEKEQRDFNLQKLWLMYDGGMTRIAREQRKKDKTK